MGKVKEDTYYLQQRDAKKHKYEQIGEK